MTVGPNKIVEGWFDAYKAQVVPRLGQEALDSVMPCFDVAEFWKGDNGAKLYHKAMAHLAEAPMTLIHGDVNPGNIWKSRSGKTGDEKYCLADWQLMRMGEPPTAVRSAAPNPHALCTAPAPDIQIACAQSPIANGLAHGARTSPSHAAPVAWEFTTPQVGMLPGPSPPPRHGCRGPNIAAKAPFYAAHISDLPLYLL